MTQRVSNAGRKKQIRPPLAITLVLSLYVTLIYMCTYTSKTHVDQSVVLQRWCCTDALFYSTEYKPDTTPGLFTVRLRFSIFVNDTGLNSVHVYVGASSSLCSPVIPSFSFSFSYSIFPSLSFSATPFSVFAERFDQRCLRSRRIRDDQWGINARRDRQSLVRVLCTPIGKRERTRVSNRKKNTHTTNNSVLR